MRHGNVFSCILLATAALAGGCVHDVYSPPTRNLPLDSSATLAPKEGSVRGSVQTASGVLGPDVGGGSVGFRHGFSDRAEIQIDGTVMHVAGDSEADTNPNIYAGRVGVKVEPGDSEYFAFTGGAGGGISAAGVFASADLGAVIAWENCYFVPYVSGGGFVSEPIHPKPVDTTPEGDKIGSDVDTPQTTLGGGMSLGARIPLGHQGCTRRAPVNLHFAGGFVSVTDRDDSETFGQAALGLEIGF